MKPTSSVAQLKTPGLSILSGRSPRSATMRRTPASLYRSRNSPMLSRVPSMQDRCGATSMPVSALVLAAVSMVPERVVPPAPKVTEKNAGLSAASGPRATVRFFSPAGVLGGNSSTLKTLGYLYWVCMNFPQPPNRTDRTHARCRHYWPKPGGDPSTCVRDRRTYPQSRLCDTMCDSLYNHRSPFSCKTSAVAEAKGEHCKIDRESP